MPILEGTQGGFKSTGVRFLVGDDWYCTITGDLVSKDTLQCHQGKWVAELDELGSLLRSTTQEQVKSYFSRPTDRYRPPYGKIPRDFKRQLVSIGTTNRWQYLTDETGARRQWPVRCERPADVKGISRDRDQIWAEAYVRFAKGEEWHVPADNVTLLAEFERQQEERFQEHPWQERIDRWLTDPAASVRRTQGVTVAAILSDCMGLMPREQGTREASTVSAILRRMKWKPGLRTRDGRARVTRWQPEAMPSAVEAPSGVRPTVEPATAAQTGFFDLDEERGVGQ
jgi:predicted P-loop ATPase